MCLWEEAVACCGDKLGEGMKKRGERTLFHQRRLFILYSALHESDFGNIRTEYLFSTFQFCLVWSILLSRAYYNLFIIHYKICIFVVKMIRSKIKPLTMAAFKPIGSHHSVNVLWSAFTTQNWRHPRQYSHTEYWNQLVIEES